MVKKRRTLLQRAKSIFNYLNYYEEPIAKSRFQKVGISPREIDQWLELIQLIQSMPLVTVKSSNKRTYVDILENKFMMHMKRKYLNQDASYVEREGAILLYFRTMLTFERLKGEDVDMEELINRRWEIDRPTIMRIAEDAIAEIEK
jgi:hypothetical protein